MLPTYEVGFMSDLRLSYDLHLIIFDKYIFNKPLQFSLKINKWKNGDLKNYPPNQDVNY